MTKQSYVQDGLVTSVAKDEAVRKLVEALKNDPQWRDVLRKHDAAFAAPGSLRHRRRKLLLEMAFGLLLIGVSYGVGRLAPGQEWVMVGAFGVLSGFALLLIASAGLLVMMSNTLFRLRVSNLEMHCEVLEATEELKKLEEEVLAIKASGNACAPLAPVQERILSRRQERVV